MNEADFDALIDGNLPYHDLVECERLMDLAKSISDEALFSVLHEICRPGYGTGISKKVLIELALLWRTKATHPLAINLFKCAHSMIDQKLLSIDSAVELLNEISCYPGQYSALNIAYYSCDDVYGIVDARWNEIRAAWHE